MGFHHALFALLVTLTGALPMKGWDLDAAIKNIPEDAIKDYLIESVNPDDPNLKTGSLTKAQLIAVLRAEQATAKKEVSKNSKVNEKIQANNNVMAEMADSIGDMPAADVAMKDDTVKAMGQTVVGEGAKQAEMEHMADKMMEDPVSRGVENINTDLNNAQQSKAMEAETEIQKAEEAVEQEEPKEAKTEVEFALKNEDMAQFDTDNDGLLDASEITAQIKKSMKTLTLMNKRKFRLTESKGLQDLVAALDENKDGKVEMGELYGKNASNPKFGVPTKDSKFRRDLFKFADENSDGALDANEMFLLTHPEFARDPTMLYHMKAMDHIIAMDANKDSRITWAEYWGPMKREAEWNMKALFPGVSKEAAEKEVAAQGVHRQAAFDANAAVATTTDKGEPALNLKGMAKMLRDYDDEFMYKKDVAAFIQAGDDNKDGKLSLAEIIKHASSYGGSAADFAEDPSLMFKRSSSKLNEWPGEKLAKPLYDEEEDISDEGDA
jgi:Ca2+-binding EF-hand superfamily protein